jgi:hypothetical protein
MELNETEKELLNNYIPTLKRHFKKNINYPFFKSPFFEKFVLKLSILNSDSELIGSIVDKINNQIISNEDIYFSIQYYSNFSKTMKANIQKFIFNNNDIVNIKFKTNVVLFNVKYFQYYYFINELLFHSNDLDLINELFYSIYLFLKNNELTENECEYNSEMNHSINIKQYCRKYFNMKIFFYLIDDLFRIYKKNLDLLIKNEIIEKLNIHELFMNNIFGKWSLDYKKKIVENTFDEIEKNYKLKNKSFMHFICSKNIC